MALVEFQDLPDTTTPVTANNLNKIQESNIYSTNEIEIGKWLNKPLYRKVLTVGAITTQTVQEISTPSNIDYLKTMEGMLIESSGNEIPINYINIFGQGNDIGAMYVKTESKIKLKCWANYDITSGYIIIEYTKTTD